MLAITSSIVVYKNDINILKKTVGSFLDTDLAVRLYLIDNSPSDAIREICKDERVEYIFNDRNLGFGAGHNMAMRKTGGRSLYHLVLNPDVFFPQGVLESLFNFMEQDKGVGLVMPKVCFPDNSLQYLCKLLPAPYDFILRRPSFRALRAIFRDKYDNYDLKTVSYNRIMDVPSLSGCFMFIRSDVFGKAGMFDERFFMHFEDIDFTRRIRRYYRTVYYPEAVVYHDKAGGKSLKELCHLTASFVKYFNKWGWAFDEERKRINRDILEKLRSGQDIC